MGILKDDIEWLGTPGGRKAVKAAVAGNKKTTFDAVIDMIFNTWQKKLMLYSAIAAAITTALVNSAKMCIYLREFLIYIWRLV